MFIAYVVPEFKKRVDVAHVVDALVALVEPGGPVEQRTAGGGVGPGWSGYLLFLSTIALSVMTFLSFRASGEKVPEIKKDTPPAA